MSGNELSNKEINEEAKKARKTFEQKLEEVAPGPLDGRNSLKPVYIEAFSLEDAWYQSLSKLLTEGYAYKITKGSFKGNYRLGFDYATIRITNPETRPLAPLIPEGMTGVPPPTTDEGIEQYVGDYLLNGREKTENEDYTYGERIVDPKARLEETLDVERIEKIKKEIGINIDLLPDESIKKLYPNVIGVKRENGKIILQKDIPFGVNSVQQVIDNYKTKGFGSNQEILQVGAPADIVLPDPPCLRHIDTRIRYFLNGKNKEESLLHFIVYFRSWDLYAGLPENLGGIQRLKEHMAGEIGVKPGETIAASKGLHIYQYAGEIVEMLTRRELQLNNKK